MNLRLPDFIVIGAFKSGTTSLMSYLGQHERVFVPWLQEPNYFGSPSYDRSPVGEKRPHRVASTVYGRFRTDTLAQYAALFEGLPTDVIAGESSPQYLRDTSACPRIREMLPDVKLMAILRHPAERAFSDYTMFVRDGLEHDNFAAAIQRRPGNEPFHHYVETGFYGRQLRTYCETFPANQLRVMLFEDLLSDPVGLVGSCFEWLGVSPEFHPDVTSIRNVSGVPRTKAVALGYRMRRQLQPYLKRVVPQGVQRSVDSWLIRGLDKPELDPALRAQLIDVYADDIKLLGELINRDLRHWLR